MSSTIRCKSCGASFEKAIGPCPHCGGEVELSVQLTGVEAKTSLGSMTGDSRVSLTGHFLTGAAFQARESLRIEMRPASDVSEEEIGAHLSYVLGAIMQATAALEAEIWEVMVYGPGHHLGSNGTDLAAKVVLSPKAKNIDRKRVTQRYQQVLKLLGKTEVDESLRFWQDASLVVDLRNELVHYKSRWGRDLGQTALLAESLRNILLGLQNRNFPKPPFIPDASAFFPFRCLSASCAAWAVDSCVAFLDAFYVNLEMPGRLDPYRDRLRTTPKNKAPTT